MQLFLNFIHLSFYTFVIISSFFNNNKDCEIDVEERLQVSRSFREVCESSKIVRPYFH